MRTCLSVLLAATLALGTPLRLSSDQISFSSSPTTSLSLNQPAILALSHNDRAALLEHIASLKEVVRVRTSAGEEIETTEGSKAILTLNSIKFVDITNEVHYAKTQINAPFPETLKYTRGHLGPVFDHIDTGKMKSFLTKFTSFRTRYYRSQTGAESQQFLLATLKAIAKSNDKINIKFTEFKHSWGQNSIIARFDPVASINSKAALSDEIVIIGAHQDSTNLLPFLAAPGADDDGSGTTSTLTAFAALVNASFVPSTNPVEFHWYSAEEGGLLGSQAVANDYAAKGKKVRSMIQMDMTAWVKKGTDASIGIIQDFVDPEFTQFVTKVVAEYNSIPSVATKCGYACSDHASWTKIGAPSAFSIESSFENSNHNIHSGNDRIDFSDEFSFDHMAEFSKLAIALVVELGGGDSLAGLPM